MANETLILGNNNWAVKANNLLGYAVGETSGDYVPREFTFSRNSTATYTDKNGIIQTAAANIARVQNNALLLEPQRTNLALRSEEFDNASWTKTNTTITANTTTSPDGNSTADTLTGDGTSSLHGVEQSISVTSGTTYSWSIYAKKNTNNFLQIVASSGRFGSNVWANFDLNDGVLGSVGSSTTASIQNVGNGWYRCIMTATATGTGSAATYILNLISSSTSGRSESNTLSTSVYIWGSQFEQGAYVSTYIPTTTATVTRVADSAVKTGISSLIGQSEGTVFVEFSTNNLETYTRRLFSLSDGTNSNQIDLQIQANTTTLTFAVINGGATQAVINTSANYYTLGSVIKIGCSYKQNDFIFYINGSQIGVDTSGTVPTCSEFKFSSPLNINQFIGGINKAALFTTRLTNAELATLTT